MIALTMERLKDFEAIQGRFRNNIKTSFYDLSEKLQNLKLKIKMKLDKNPKIILNPMETPRQFQSEQPINLASQQDSL